MLKHFKVLRTPFLNILRVINGVLKILDDIKIGAQVTHFLFWDETQDTPAVGSIRRYSVSASLNKVVMTTKLCKLSVPKLPERIFSSR
ncbi:hypothetical protein BLNAU_15413 [Blattamonas nauphoetae]|uniref:Uncharacterized protein n=1 Tax=Blattamonas nauphoetae TaxID=2049346 RepID=A0ABQ9XG95_9EUKA|nr:hypothetical protein BLNAU_15413 [Blattamonas nauphoetae]